MPETTIRYRLLGAELRRLRTERGLSLAKVGELSARVKMLRPVKRATLSQHERAQRAPSIDALFALAEVYDTAPEQLFDYCRLDAESQSRAIPSLSRLDHQGRGREEMRAGRPRTAMAHYAAAISETRSTVFEDERERDQELAPLLIDLANAARRCGRHRVARDSLEEVLGLRSTSEELRIIALYTLAALHLDNEAWPIARALAEQCAHRCRTAGVSLRTDVVAAVDTLIAAACHAEGAYAEALRRYRVAAASYEEEGDLPRLATVHASMARCMVQSGDVGEGLQLHRRAREMAARTQDATARGRVLLAYAESCLDGSRREQATAIFREVSALAAGTDEELLEFHARYHLWRLLRDSEPEEAAKHERWLARHRQQIQFRSREVRDYDEFRLTHPRTRRD